MNIKQQALEAARPYAHNFNDLLEKAAKIEAFLNESSHAAIAKSTPQPIREMYDPAEDKGMLGPIVDERTQEEIDFEKDNRIHAFDEDGNDIIDDDASELINLAKNLVSDLDELGFNTNLSENTTRLNEGRNIEELAKVRLKELSEAVKNCDLSTSPPMEQSNYSESRSMENYTIAFKHRGASYEAKLRPYQIGLGKSFEKDNVVLNIARTLGSSTMIAAFAREVKARGKKILVLTNSYSNAMMMQEMIDDVAVDVYDYNKIGEISHKGQRYDYIVLDNAAFIPYAIEDRVKEYIEACKTAQLSYTPMPVRIIMVSVPGQARGWFYKEYSTPHGADFPTKVTADWRWSDMTPEEAKRLKAEMGAEAFANQFENKFRPVKD